MGDRTIFGLGCFLEEELELISRCARIVESVRRALSGPVCEENGNTNASRIPGTQILDEWLRTGDVSVRNRTVGNDRMRDGKYVVQSALQVRGYLLGRRYWRRGKDRVT